MAAFLASPSALRSRGVLGINRRISNYVQRYNPRSLLPRVDDKALTAELAEAHGLPMPRSYLTLRFNSEVRGLERRLEGLPDFVVKPASGSMGNGIIVARRMEQVEGAPRFAVGGGRVWELKQLNYHVATILSGLFSLDGNQDRAIFQERIECDARIARLSEGGVPDIRIILLRGVPVMAMLRVATLESRGRANLHQGAVGIGVSLASGVTHFAMRRGHSLSHHPDSGVALLGVALPLWPECLTLAVRVSDALNLGYLGVDIVLDAKRGPVLLEGNARPGLAIQLANQAGLAHRLEAIEALPELPMTVEARIALAQSLDP